MDGSRSRAVGVNAICNTSSLSRQRYQAQDDTTNYQMPQYWGRHNIYIMWWVLVRVLVMLFSPTFIIPNQIYTEIELDSSGNGDGNGNSELNKPSNHHYLSKHLLSSNKDVLLYFHQQKKTWRTTTVVTSLTIARQITVSVARTTIRPIK